MLRVCLFRSRYGPSKILLEDEMQPLLAPVSLVLMGIKSWGKIFQNDPQNNMKIVIENKRYSEKWHHLSRSKTYHRTLKKKISLIRNTIFHKIKVHYLKTVLPPKSHQNHMKMLSKWISIIWNKAGIKNIFKQYWKRHQNKF